MPNPAIAASRAPNGNSQPPAMPLNSFPRLAADSEGTVYLAFRTVGAPVRSPVGTVWFENVAYFDGSEWKGPVFVPRTDGLLDSRASMLPVAPRRLLVVATIDH